jgi:N-acetylglucosamine-6-phosphate deacetylase
VIVLSGAAIVLPDRILNPGTLVVDGERIVEVRAGTTTSASAAPPFAFQGFHIVPGFIDVHVHGVEGMDSLDEGEPIAAMAALLPRFGVTAFCPTTVACAPQALNRVLTQVKRARGEPQSRSARVLPAHLESNFINVEYRGAQPSSCLRSPQSAFAGGHEGPPAAFDGADILREIERSAPDIGIVTVAPELDGGADLVAWLTARGHLVSLGHSAATYDETLAAVAAGARQATHLFNAMPPIHHRAPGLAGAVLQAEEVAAELICDGTHVHPSIIRMAVRAKRPSRLLAITDGTAGAGLVPGGRARLGGQPITTRPDGAYLDDGTLAGSVLTMNRAFERLVTSVGLSPVEAATMCATTPARELGLVGYGLIARDAVADLVVLDPSWSVVQTYIGGRLVYQRGQRTE